MTLDGLFIGIDGSASTSANRDLLRRCHELVRALTLHILQEDGGLAIFVGKEPRIDETAAESSIVFTWTIMETILQFLNARVGSETKSPRVLARAVYSPNSIRNRIPEHRRPVWEELLAREALTSTVLEEDDHTGGKIREAQVAIGDAAVLISGGKGVRHLSALYREKQKIVVPLGPDIGASLNDGLGARELYQQALVKPGDFSKIAPEKLRNILASISFEANKINQSAANIVAFLSDAVRPAMSTPNEPVDIAVVTVIAPELKAARKALSIEESAIRKNSQGTNYWHGRVRSLRANRDYHVALTCIGNPGNPESTAATVSVIHELSPKIVVLMGIAAGVRGKVKIGHVILSDRIFGYESGAEIIDNAGPRMVPRPEVGRMEHSTEQDVTAYLSQEYLPRLEAMMIRFNGPYPQPKTKHKKEFREHVATSAGVQLATIASGEKLLKNPEKLRVIREHHGRTEAGEMEAMGFYTACRRSHTPWLVVRGISDFGDELKDDKFHELASNAAASVMVDMIVHAIWVD